MCICYLQTVKTVESFIASQV